MKFWRQRKPIMVYTGGALDLQDLTRLGGVLERQVKKLKKVVKRYG